MIDLLTIFILAFIQNVSFSIVSRSRNRDNIKYHLIASFFSNTVWFLTFRELIQADMNWILFMPYAIGTMIGSVLGAKISMKIESMIGATSDGHVQKFQPTGILRWNDDLNNYEIHVGKDKWEEFKLNQRYTLN